MHVLYMSKLLKWKRDTSEYSKKCCCDHKLSIIIIIINFIVKIHMYLVIFRCMCM